MQPSLPHRADATVPALLASQNRGERFLFLAIFFTTLIFTLLVVFAGIKLGLGMILAGFGALVIAAAIVRWRVVGFFVIATCALIIEQGFNQIPIVTDQLYIFYWPPNLEGQIERPVGYIMILILFLFVCHRFISRQQPILQGGELLKPLLFFLFCLAIGIFHGLTSGGDLKIIVVEIRPFVYLSMSYLIAHNLVVYKSHLRAFFWLVIICAGVKALQGLYIYLIYLHGVLPDHDSIMAHEESFFFASFIILLMLLFLYRRYRPLLPQLYVGLLLLPLVIVIFVANQRRVGYIALLAGIAVTWMLVYRVRQERYKRISSLLKKTAARIVSLQTVPFSRKTLVTGMLIFVALFGGYVAIFGNTPSTSGFAGPAHSIVSVFQTSGDTGASGLADSNLYRTAEDFDLKFTAMQNPVLGLGFGKPFSQPISLTGIYSNILHDDQYYNYVPHNTIYWVWMRLGVLGFFAFLYLLGAIIVRGCLAARQLHDPYLQLAAIYIVAITIMIIIGAFADYELYAFRTAIYLGLLAGILAKLPAIDGEIWRRGQNETLRLKKEKIKRLRPEKEAVSV